MSPCTHMRMHPGCAALDRAVRYYRERPEWWRELAARNMSDAARWSWDTAAGSYVELYQKVVQL